MNKEWSELCKQMQTSISKKTTFEDGKKLLFQLRDQLFSVIEQTKTDLAREEYNINPFPKAKGNHNATIAWSLWHVFRIEDIVVQTMIKKEEQLFFSGNYKSRTNSPIITTANELIQDEITDFSKQLNLDELYNYIREVKESTDKMIEALTYEELKIKFTEEDKQKLKLLEIVSTNDDSFWLIDYWCGKNIKGLINMPLSRHWIMHVEALNYIKEKILEKR